MTDLEKLIEKYEEEAHHFYNRDEECATNEQKERSYGKADGIKAVLEDLEPLVKTDTEIAKLLTDKDNVIFKLDKQVQDFKKAMKLITANFPKEVMSDQMGEDYDKFKKLTK